MKNIEIEVEKEWKPVFKQCPFCGSERIGTICLAISSHALCHKCECIGPATRYRKNQFTYEDKQAEAAKKWNKRSI